MDGGLEYCTRGSDQGRPQENKMQKGKMVFQGGLTLAEKRKDTKGKGEKERYPFEFRVPKIATKDKKAYLSDQCKEIVENNRMQKTRDLFKEIRVTKGTFHA